MATRVKKKKPPEPEWITVDAAALILDCSARSVRRLIAEGKLTYQRPIPRSTKVLRSEVEALLLPKREG